MSTAKEYNAVFKGGGAKGIAYAGALQACEEQGIVFSEVAGSSAGAITATLVACGYSATEIVQEMPNALASIGNVPESLAMIGMRPSLLGNDRLHTWLSKAIGDKIGEQVGKAGKDCTFADIERVESKKLYVVTLDLATRQPRVFSPDLTPDSPVADAVVASSAIPVAFPSARMSIEGRVHRLVDGGTWSNYPDFVFHDNGFRHCHDLGDNPRPTLGFILDDGERPEVPDRNCSPLPHAGGRLMGDRGSSTDQLKVPGAVLSSPAFRWLVALLPLLFVALSIMWLHDEMRRPDPWIDRLPENIHDATLVAAVSIFSLTGVLALAMSFAVIRLGRTLFDSGLVGAMAAIGVGPSVAYWVGQGRDEDHIAVRINVPHSLTTLKFNADAQTRLDACAAGYTATRVELAKLAAIGDLAPSLAPAPMMVVTPDRAARPGGFRIVFRPVVALLSLFFALLSGMTIWLAGLLRNKAWARIAATVYVLIGGTTATFAVLRNLAQERALMALAWLGIVGTAVALGAWLLANGRWNEATTEQPYRRLGTRSVVQLRSIGIASLAMTGFFLAGTLTAGDASIMTASRAAQLTGQVDDVRGGGDQWAVDVVVRDIDLVATLDDVDDDTFERHMDRVFEQGLFDLYRRSVADCGWTDQTSCFTVMTTREPEVAERGTIELRADLARGRLFLEQDIWDADRGQLSIQVMLIVGLIFLGLGARSLRAARWKCQQPPSCDPSARDELGHTTLTEADLDGIDGSDVQGTRRTAHSDSSSMASV